MSPGGWSSTRLARMRNVMAGHVERGDVPGLVTLVSRRGEVHVETLGRQAVDGSAPIRRDTIFRIASMTKPIIAAATMMLVEECTLRLDEPVQRWLPELADRQVLKRLDGPLDDTIPAHRPITVRDLLTFRLGLGIVLAPPDTYPIQQAVSALHIVGFGPTRPQAPHDPDAWMQRLGTLPLMHQPGEQWLYNTGSDVLGVLLARAAGQPLETFLRARLFEPLGMQDTGFSVPATKIARLATCYHTNPDSGALEIYDEAAAGQWSRPPAFPSGGGGLVSTVDDYLAFGQMLLHQGKHGKERLLSRPAVELMTTNHLTPMQQEAASVILGDNRGWGFGVSVVTRRDDVAAGPGRFGWDGGLGTSWASEPREEMVAILMTQRAWDDAGPPGVYGDFWTSTYQAIDD